MDRDVWRDVCITVSCLLVFSFSSWVSQTLSPPPALSFFSPPLSHISVSFCFSYLSCPSRPEKTLPFLRCFSYPLAPLIIPDSSLSPLRFSFKHLLSITSTPLALSQMEVVAHLLLLPTYHRACYICHHLLIPRASSPQARKEQAKSIIHSRI